MNTKQNIFIILFLITHICVIGLILITTFNNSNNTFIVKNNDTRDYKFEHYCDSIYDNNPDYYLDVLVETDEFQNYLEQHRK